MQSSLAQFQIIKVFTHFIVQCKHKLPQQQVNVDLRTTASTPQRTEEEHKAVLGNNVTMTNNYLI